MDKEALHIMKKELTETINILRKERSNLDFGIRMKCEQVRDIHSQLEEIEEGRNRIDEIEI